MLETDEIVAMAKRCNDEVERFTKRYFAKPVVLPERFDPALATTQSAWMSGPHKDTLYVWLHIDDAGDPFYAGRGRGPTAWDRNGGPAWEWFVRERLGGSYGVLILAHSLTDDHSEALLDNVFEAYCLRLLNRANFHRPHDPHATDAPGALPHHYDGVRQTEDEDERLWLALDAQQMQYESGGTAGECGRFGEVLAAMGATSKITAFFIPYIVEGYMVKGDVSAAREALDEFVRCAPHLANEPKVQRLAKIIERGTFKRRPRKKQEA